MCMKVFPNIDVAVLFASASPEHLDSVRHKGGLKALSAKLEEVHSKYYIQFILLHVFKKIIKQLLCCLCCHCVAVATQISAAGC